MLCGCPSKRNQVLEFNEHDDEKIPESENQVDECKEHDDETIPNSDNWEETCTMKGGMAHDEILVVGHDKIVQRWRIKNKTTQKRKGTLLLFNRNIVLVFEVIPIMQKNLYQPIQVWRKKHGKRSLRICRHI